MSLCEIIFSTRKYPDLKDSINSCYSLLDIYDHKMKDLKKLYQSDPNNIHPKLKDLAELLNYLEKQDSGFKEYFLTSKSHNKKREKALKIIDEVILSDNRKQIDLLNKLELELDKFDIAISKFYKLYSAVKEIRTQIISTRDCLATKTADSKNLFRSLYKV